MIDDFVRPELRNKPTKTLPPLEKPATTDSQKPADKEEPDFVRPEDVAAADLADQDVATSAPVELHTKKRPHLLRPRTKRQKILSSVLAVLLAFGVGAAWTLTHHKRSVQAVSSVHKTVKKAVLKPIIYSTLSGLPVTDASVNQRPVTGVMIENSLDARPQSGLSQAGVVFEAVAEGGVTRFLGLFQDQTPDNVGPIRSARPYYIQWDMGFDAAYAHVGGSPDALADISSWGVKDMNQFYNGGSYHRVSSRAAPHNVYTGIGTLNQLEAAKGYTSTYNGFLRKADQPYKSPAVAPTTTPATKTRSAPTAPDTRTPAASIDMALSGPIYNPHYDYNAATNSYNRSEGGSPHVDANTNAQLNPKVVVAMIMQKSQGALDSSGAYYTDYTVVGGGTVFIFQDGTVTQGTWNKADMKSQITFTDAAGQPITLNRGQTWLTALGATNQVTYK